MELIEKVREIIEPEIQLFGAELLSLDLKGKPGRFRLYIVADTVDGITIDQCTQISRRILNVPELEEILGTNYILEVSSPGVDWPLKTEREFRLKIGRDLEVSYFEGEEERKVRGQLMAVDSEAILLKTAGETQRIFYSQIKKAIQALPW